VLKFLCLFERLATFSFRRGTFRTELGLRPWKPRLGRGGRMFKTSTGLDRWSGIFRGLAIALTIVVVTAGALFSPPIAPSPTLTSAPCPRLRFPVQVDLRCLRAGSCETHGHAGAAGGERQSSLKLAPLGRFAAQDASPFVLLTEGRDSARLSPQLRCTPAWHVVQSVIRFGSESSPDWLRNSLW